MTAMESTEMLILKVTKMIEVSQVTAKTRVRGQKSLTRAVKARKTEKLLEYLSRNLV